MATLEIRLLGPAEVTHAGRPVRIPRRRIRALLYYLAAAPRSHSRAHLATLFWGDSSDREAARALSDALYRLRQALQPAAPVATAGEQVAIEPRADCWIDLDALEARLANVSQDDSALDDLVALWRGPLLEGFDLADCPDFEDWLALERRRVEACYLEALAALCERQASLGAHDAALRAAEQMLRVDPLREDAHRWAMRLQAARGNRAAALRQYELARATLARELGIGPSPETDALRERIARGEPDTAMIVVAAPETIAPRASPIGLVTDDAPPLVGREQSMAALSEQLGAALQGRGQVALVAGEAGIGKSRLVAELLRTVPPDARILSASCQASARDVAFQPLIDALRGALATDELGTLGLPPPLWPQLARLLPELPATSGAAAASLTPAALPGSERGRLFEALVWVLVTLARRAPLVVVLDDLHWADDATLTFLAYAARRLAGERCLLLGTYRDDEVGSALRQTIGELSRYGLLARLVLERLNADETVELVDRLANGRPGSDVLGQRLHRESDGNPLFIGELVRNLAERGLFDRDVAGDVFALQAAEPGSSLALPDSLRQLIADRLGRLSEATRRALEVAAVLGNELTGDLLRDATGWADEQAVEALEELLRARLLVELASGRYGFGHDKIREVVYDELSDARRTLLHRRAGQALAAVATVVPGLLAYHFGRGRAWRQAHQHAVAAAERAVEAHANREAAAHYDLALEAAGQLGGEIGPAQLAALHEQRGRVRLGMSDYGAAIEDFERSLDNARLAGDAARALSARRYLALAHFWRHEPAERALAYVDQALVEARRLDDRHEVAACAAVRAAILVTRGRLREGIGQAEEAIRVGRESGDEYLVADATGTLGMAYGWRGDFARARAELASSLEQARARHWGLLVPRALFFSAINAAAVGQYEPALALLAECLRYARESDDRWWLARVPNTLGWVYQELGDHETALRHDLEGVEAALESPWPEPLGNALVNLEADHLRTGDFAAASSALQRATALLGRDETMQWRWETRLWLGLGELELARGSPERALDYAERALLLARETRAAKNAVRARRLQGLALVASGRPELARASLGRAVRLAGRLGSPRLAQAAHTCLAAVERGLGRDAAAERHARAAATIVETVAASLTDETLRVCFRAAAVDPFVESLSTRFA